MRRVAASVLLAASLALTSAACSSSSDKTVDRGEVEEQVKTQLGKSIGSEPETVSCPEKLKAKVDATTRCVLTADDGSKIGATVTVTKVSGSTASFDIKVDDEIMSGPTN